jgi:hypothetical protein
VAVKSVLRASRTLPPRKSSGTYFCLELSKPKGQVRLKGLGKFKYSMTSSEIKPATFGLVE